MASMLAWLAIVTMAALFDGIVDADFKSDVCGSSTKDVKGVDVSFRDDDVQAPKGVTIPAENRPVVKFNSKCNPNQIATQCAYDGETADPNKSGGKAKISSIRVKDSNNEYHNCDIICYSSGYPSLKCK